MSQRFYIGGQWISREIMLRKRKEAKEAKIAVTPRDPASPQEVKEDLEYDAMEIKELREVYEGLFEKKVAPAYKNKKEWIINKIKDFRDEAIS